MSLLARDVGGTLNTYPPGNLSSSSYVTSLSGQSWGNGSYVASASTDAFTNANAYAAFSGAGSYWASSGAQYSIATGSYGGSFVTSNVQSTSYSGEWIQLQLPYPIVPTSYTLTSTYLQGYTPKTFVLLGSSDGSAWYTVDSRTVNSGSEAALSSYVCSNLSGGGSPPYTKAHSIFRLVVTNSWGARNVVINSLYFTGSPNPAIQNTPSVPSSGPISFSQIKAAYGAAYGSNFQAYGATSFASFRGKTAQTPVVGSNLLASVTTPLAGTNTVIAPGGGIVGTAGSGSTVSINLQNYASTADGTLVCALSSYTGSATTVSVSGTTLTIASTASATGTAVVSLTNRFGNVQYVTFPYSFLPSPPSSSGLVALYTGESYVNGVWADVSGNGNNAVVSGGSVSILNAGLLNGRSYLKGTSATTVSFPSAVLPSTYTLMHVARYEPTGSTFGRILEGTTSNSGFLSGFWNGLAGCAYHNGTVGLTSGNSLADWATANGGGGGAYGTNWLLSMDTNSTYRANGVTVGTTGAGTPSYAQLAINNYQPSDFDMGCIAVYNNAISTGNSPAYEAWMGSLYGIPVATAASSAAPAIIGLSSGAPSSNVNLASLAINCTAFSVALNPNSNNSISFSGTSVTITGSLQSSLNYTVVIKASSSVNGAYTFVPIGVTETASVATPVWATSYPWVAASNAYLLSGISTSGSQSLTSLCTVTGGTPTFTITSNPKSNVSINSSSGILVIAGAYRNATYNVGVLASYTSNANTSTSSTTFAIVENPLTSITLFASNLSYSGLSNVAVTDYVYVSFPQSSYLTGASYLYNAAGQAGSWTSTFTGILSIGGTNGQLSITPNYRGTGSSPTYTALISASVTLNGATASNTLAIPITEASLATPTWASPFYSYTSIVGSGPLTNGTWSVSLNSPSYCTSSIGTLSFQIVSVTPSQSVTPCALSGTNNGSLTVTGAYRGSTYTIVVQATATYGSLSSTASASFSVTEGSVPAPTWTLSPASTNQSSMGTSSLNYASIVNLAGYCTNATNYYITSSPQGNVTLVGSVLEGLLNKPGQSYTIGLSASNVGAYTSAGSAASFTIYESPYVASSPATQTIGVASSTLTLNASTYIQGASSYGFNNTNGCPDASINSTSGAFTIANNFRNATYNFFLTATANGMTVSTASFAITEPSVVAPVWSGLASSFVEYSSGPSNASYSTLIVSLPNYCTNATNYYITTSPTNYVTLTGGNALYSALNKPGQISTITVAASNIGTYSLTGASASFTIVESPYAVGTPGSGTAPYASNASGYFSGASSYGFSNYNVCPDASLVSGVFGVVNNYRNYPSYTFSLYATANGLTVSTGNFTVASPIIPTPVWSIASSISAQSLGSANSSYTGLVVNLAAYSTNATNYYITTSPANYVILTGTSLYSALNKPGQTSSITIAASNIGYSQTGASTSFTIAESPYALSTPGGGTAPYTISASTYFVGATSYGFVNTNSCPDATLTSGSFVVSNNYRNAAYSFQLTATANGTTVTTGYFTVTEPIVPTPTWTLPSSFSESSLGAANSNYSALIVNLSTYCTNATNYYITTSPTNYVTLTGGTTVYSTLNKPLQTSTITVAASNIGTYSGAAGAAATFTINESLPPAVTSGTMSLWLDASTLPTNGSLSTWTDGSSHAYSFTSLGGSNPTVVTNALNSKPGLKFTGGQFMMTSNYTQQFATTNSLFFVMSGISGANVGGIVVFKGTSTPNWQNTGSFYGQTKIWMGDGLPSNVSQANQNSVGNFPSLACWALGYFLDTVPINPAGTAVCMQTTSSNTMNYYMNNIAVTPNSPFTAGTFYNGIDSNYTYLYIGGPSGVNSSPFTGYIHEILHYNGAMSSNDVSSVNSYLTSKWGIANNNLTAPMPVLSVPAQSFFTGSNVITMSSYCTNYASTGSYTTSFALTANPNSNASISGATLTVVASSLPNPYNLTIRATNSGTGLVSSSNSDTFTVTELVTYFHCLATYGYSYSSGGGGSSGSYPIEAVSQVSANDAYTVLYNQETTSINTQYQAGGSGISAISYVTNSSPNSVSGLTYRKTVSGVNIYYQ